MKLWCALTLFALVSSSTFAQTKTVAFRNTQEAVTYYEQLIEEVVKRVNMLQEDNAKLQANVMELNRKVAAQEAANQTLSQEVSKLSRQIAADAQVRNAQLEKISKQVTAAPAPVSSASASDSGDSGDSGEYEIYEVQAGATLSAISQAYGVSIQSIKTANRMKNDNLRIGQKLKIPVKK